jgi:Phage portal protein
VSRRRKRYTQATPRPLDKPDLRSIVAEELQKALNLPAGAQTYNMAAQAQQLQTSAMQNALLAGTPALPRAPFNTGMFGPGEPLIPAPISPLLPTGRPSPRQSEYRVSENLQLTMPREVPWSILRNAADNVSIVRSCIEVLKSSVTGLEWSFSIDSGRARALAKRSSASNHEVIIDLQDKFADDIERLHQWWARPAWGWTLTEWLNAVIEDEVVYDAVALYPRFNYRGDLLAMEQIDASTIKPLLDERGSTPIWPLAAYQQVLWGFPRGDYSPLPRGEIDGEYFEAVYGQAPNGGARTDSLIYKVRNRRSRGPYGFSCVEQCLPDVNLWLNRWEWLNAEYTAGVMPQLIMKVDAAMTPEQMREWQSILNDALSGNSNERHRAQFVPQGFEPIFPAGFEAKFANDIDLHLIRLICASFDILPTSLGFTPNHGMGGSGGQGHQQGEADTQLNRATKPRVKWLTNIINEISTTYLGMPPEVTFTFHGLDDKDEQAEATLLQGYVDNALLTVNEGRDRLNMPRFAIEQANEPSFSTPTGPAFLNPAVQPVGMPGNLPSAAQNNPGQPELPAKKAPAAIEAPKASRDEAVQDAGTSKKAQEARAFEVFLTKANGRPSREFLFYAFPPEVAKAANLLAAEGDADSALLALSYG